MGAHPSTEISQIDGYPNRRRAYTTNSHKVSRVSENNGVIMTEFDVKKLMERTRAGTVCVSSRSSTEERVEKDLMENVRKQEPTRRNSWDDKKAPNESVNQKKSSISSKRSIRSDDSGVGSHDNSPASSNLQLHATSSEQPTRKSTVTEVKINNGGKKIKVAKNIMRKMLRKKKNDQGEMRRRSKSVGAAFAQGEKSTPLFGSSLLNREWELVTVSEMCRRLSLDQELELPIPEGANTSQILDEIMIRQVMDILPPRAEGYPWVQIYNSEKHGFSLSTMYRKMAEFDEDLSPVLLIIRDTKEHVFGAVVSSAVRPSDHYFGTGDSCLLWRFTGEAPHTRELRQFTWTGDNQFFVNAAKDALSIGAGAGRHGLWMDADLNHGRSQRCETFDNEPLCGENEDFIIQFIEAYGFRM